MKHLIGKRFRYKSPYSGTSNWIRQIVDVNFSYTIKGVGEPISFKVVDSIQIPIYSDYKGVHEYRIWSEIGTSYTMDEIEIID
jgi:hypothetical protein